MSEQSHVVLEATAESLGDTRALAEQLGSAEELTTLGAHALAGQLTRVHSVAALREFLIGYRERTLAGHEFIQICRAWSHASKNELRELVALDQGIGSDPEWKEFMVPSHNVGKRQLNKMRLLRDNRFIQRYRQAVLDGKAHAWHTLVYGVVLETYSIPLRQGLLHYGVKTVNGFLGNAARALDLTSQICGELENEIVLGIPAVIEEAIAAQMAFGLKVLN